MSANNLNGKSVFISGSSRGIGAATVKLFAEAGARVAINYRDKEVRAQKVAEEIRARGGEAIVLKADLTDYQTVSEARDAIKEVYGQLDFLVVQDLFLHETAERAHVFLPAATFAEKEGTFTNSERRVQRVRAAMAPPGDARPDWWITAELAKRVARRLGLDVSGQFDWRVDLDYVACREEPCSISAAGRDH